MGSGGSSLILACLVCPATAVHFHIWLWTDKIQSDSKRHFFFYKHTLCLRFSRLRSVSGLLAVTSPTPHSEPVSSPRSWGTPSLGKIHAHAWSVHCLDSYPICLHVSSRWYLFERSPLSLHRLQQFLLVWHPVRIPWTHFVTPTGGNPLWPTIVIWTVLWCYNNHWELMRTCKHVAPVIPTVVPSGFVIEISHANVVIVSFSACSL